MIFGRLFRRATTPPLPSLAEALLAPLAAAGLTGVVVQGDAPEREAGIRKGVVGRGLVEITAGGTPDFVQVTSEGGGGGHLARTAAVGFHFLVRRDGLAASVAAGWGSQGKIVARREFGGVGMARDFHWEAVMEDSDVAAPQAVAAAEQLNAAGVLTGATPRAEILALLQEPSTLMLELAPALFEETPEGSGSLPRPGVIRVSVFFGRRESLEVEEIAMMRALCRTIAGVG